MRKSIIRIILAVCFVVSFSFFVGLTVNAETTGVVTDGIETIPLGESASTPIELTDGLVNYRLRCTTAVVDGNLVLTADPAGTSSMKVRLGNLPEGATVEFVGTNANANMASGIITVTNPGMKNVSVPMTITSAEGVVTEFVLVADFNNAIRYATYARMAQSGNDIAITSGATTAYVLFDTTEIDGGYVEVTDVSRNLLGRYVVSGSSIRFYNPVYDDGSVTVNVKNANGETVETYSVTVMFADATEFTALLDTSLRCTYEVDGDNIIVTANSGVSNVYLNFGRYFSETLSASVNNDVIKKMGARSWRVMKSYTPAEFDIVFDASSYDAESITRHVIVDFGIIVEEEQVADYSAVEKALAKVPTDLTVYTEETAKAVTDAVNAVVYDLTVDQQAMVDAYAKAIEEAVSELVEVYEETVFGIVTDFTTVVGERDKDGKGTYRIEITMLIDGELRNYYTEDLLAIELPDIENENGLKTDYYAELTLNSNGCIKVKNKLIDIVYVKKANLSMVENVTLSATYENSFASGITGLEKGQIQLSTGTRNYTYNYEKDVNDLFGHTLTAYFNENDELLTLVPTSKVTMVTTAEKLVGDGTYSNPFGITIGEHVQEGNTKVYKIDTVYMQRTDGSWTKSTNVNLEDLTYGRKYNNNSAKVTLIDNPDENDVLDGIVDTVLVEYQAVTQVRRYSEINKTVSITGKTLAFANAIGHEAFADADFSQTADPVFATYTLKKGSAGTVYTLAPTTTVEGVLLSANFNKGQVVVGDTTYNVFGTSMPIFYKDGGVVYTVVGDTVKLYIDAAGYVVAGVVRESDTEYDLNLGMVIDATDDMDRFGNTTATITVLKFDGTEETLTIDTVKEAYEDYDGICDIPYQFAANDSGEYVFAYDSVARDYTIVGNYVHYEVDAYDKLVDRIVAVDNYGTITPSNSVKDYEVVTYDGSETFKLCYNANNGFFTSDDGLKVKASLEEVASNFTGMYYEKDAETGEVKTEYYTASNIPEFDRTGTITLVMCDDKIVAMMVLVPPDAIDDKVLGIITGWNTVSGEAYKDGKPTYRYAVTMLVDGESRTYYTEDLLVEEINAIDIDYDALDNVNGLQTDYFATLHLEDGKIIVTYDNKLDVTYLGATDVEYAVATTVRGEYISAKNVNSWTNEVVEGWTTDAEGKPVYIPYSYDGEISFRTTTTLKLCNETKIITISGAPIDFDGTNFGEATDGLFQKTFASKISAGGDIKITDEYDGNNYIFAYTTFANDYNVVDNRGCLDTVLVFEKPVVTGALEKPDITDTGYPLSIGKVISAYDETDRYASIINASLTVVGLDGTEKTLSVETAQENTCVFEGGASKWKDTTDHGEIFFDYTLDTDYSDGNDSDYTIVGNYIHYEVDEITGKIIRIVALDNYATITPSNSVKDYQVVTYDGSEIYKLCYNTENGFFTSADGLRVEALLEEVDANFRGMYYEKDTETGEVKAEYYTASNIPEFDRTGTITLVKCDDKIVAMMVLVSPDAIDDKVLGIITGWNTVGGEAEKNGKPTYRYAVTMLVNGESHTYYTEDLLGTELMTIDIYYDALDNAKGLQVDYFAILNLEDGKIVVTSDNKLDVEYLGAADVDYAVATRIRNTTINATAVTSWEVPVVAGWTTDAEGRPVYVPENMATGGEVYLGGSVTLYACDETKYVYINSSLTDFDGTNFGEATEGLFQKTASSKVSVGEGLELSDVTNDLYYIFAYTTFANDYNVVDNRGCLDTVFVFTTPIELYW